MKLLICNSDIVPCPAEFVGVVDSQFSELLITGGFHPDTFALAFGGLLTLWATGLGIGLVIAQIRKLRTP